MTTRVTSCWLVGITLLLVCPIRPARAAEKTKTLVILIRHTNNVDTLPSLAEIETRMSAVDSNYMEYSYGQFGLEGVVNPGEAADVFGWYDYGGEAYFDMAAFMAFADPFVDFTDYSTFLFILGKKPGDPLAAWATIGKVLLNTPDGSVYAGWSKMSHQNASSGTITHELGHTFNNGHGFFRDCGTNVITESGYTRVTYGDPYDAMSLGSGHFSARRKEISGWLNGSNSLVVVTNSGRYVISPTETNTGEPKALRIQRSPSEYLYIEYRQPIGTDASFDPGADVFKGALFHADYDLLNMTPPALPYGPAPPSDIELTPTLHPGSTFIDPATGHSFTVVTNDSSGLTIDIVHTGYEFNSPAVSLVAPTSGAFVSGQVPIAALATDDSGILRVEFYYVRDFNTTSLTNSTTGSASNTFDTSWNSVNSLPNGPGSLKARAYDIYSNYTDSAWISITVSNRSYVVEYSADLNTTNWSPLEAIPGDGSIKVSTNSAVLDSTPRRFYRLKIQ